MDAWRIFVIALSYVRMTSAMTNQKTSLPYRNHTYVWQRYDTSSLVNNNLVLAESGVMEMQISNMSIVDSHRPDPPANTDTTVPLSSTPRAPRRVSTDGNGVSLLRRSHNSSSADSDIMIRRRMITEEEWNGAPHAHQKTTDDPNNLGRYKIAARHRSKIKGLVVAERGVIERQISNRSVVDVQRRSTYPPANTNTTVPLSSQEVWLRHAELRHDFYAARHQFLGRN